MSSGFVIREAWVTGEILSRKSRIRGIAFVAVFDPAQIAAIWRGMFKIGQKVAYSVNVNPDPEPVIKM